MQYKFRSMLFYNLIIGLIAFHVQWVEAVTLNSLFSDNMVIQRDVATRVWGNADVGANISVTIDGKTYETTADTSGNWMVMIEPLIVRENPYTLSIVSGASVITIQNILAGDVYLCSGQSNMELKLSGVSNATIEIANASCSNVRMFIVSRNSSKVPVENAWGSWEVCSPNVASNFSAVGYFFAREIEKVQKIPIGLIGSYWGGTAAQLWMPYSVLSSNADFHHYAEEADLANLPIGTQQTLYDQQSSAYISNIVGLYVSNGGLSAGWHRSQFDDREWNTTELPTLLDDSFSNLDGVIWFRKTITLPKTYVGSLLTLSLGSIDDYDQVWVNGELIGTTYLTTPNWWSVSRRYTIPFSLTSTGTLTIAIRVTDTSGSGGFSGPGDQMYVNQNGNEELAVSLCGSWKYKVERRLDYSIDPVKPTLPGSTISPSSLYNGMIYPLRNYSFSAVLWYQGEANVDAAAEYASLFPSLITSWRNLFVDQEMGFYFVQLANFLSPQEKPVSSSWAHLRESQTAALSLPKTGMAVAIDIGEENNIHPLNKQDVGHRLALVARALEYGESISWKGPQLKSYCITGSEIEISFTNVEGGLLSQGTILKGFSIAGDDGVYHWAKAILSGNSAIVSSPNVIAPKNVRYGWADNPGCNLYNGAGLPAVPFRTDGWINGESANLLYDSTLSTTRLLSSRKIVTDMGNFKFEERVCTATHPLKFIGLPVGTVIQLFTAYGKSVVNLKVSEEDSGVTRWYGTDSEGMKVCAGAYIARIISPLGEHFEKIVLVGGHK